MLKTAPSQVDELRQSGPMSLCASRLARLAPLNLRRQRHFVPTPTGLSTTMSVVNPLVLREPLQGWAALRWTTQTARAGGS